jgi:hypothetical protein
MTTFKVLSTHKTISVFQGVEHRPCRFRTALCPDRCGHASDIAVFNVEKYLSYENLADGDEKQEKIRCSLNGSVPYQDASISEKIKTLEAGKKYYVDYDHIYISDETNMHYPARPLKRIEEVK